MAVEEVGVKLVAENGDVFIATMKKAQDAVNGVNKTTEQAGTAGQKSSKGLAQFNQAFQSMTGISLGAAGAVMAGVVAIKKLADFSMEAIRAASDLNETMSKSEVVFQESAGLVEEMGEKAATAMGLSKNEAIGAAATYGNLFTSMGMARDVSADMSIKMVQLAADLASFNNIPVTEALEKIRAGLVGEAEPLRALGINITDAALRQEALNMGLKVGSGALDSATKAQAAYSLMLKQSTNAQGDFERTSGGLANQLRIQEAQSKNLIASIGEGLLPVWLRLVQAGNKVLKFLDDLINRDKDLKLANKAVQVSAEANTGSYKAYSKALEEGVKANGEMIDSEGNLIRVLMPAHEEAGNMVEATYEIVEANYKMSESTYATIQMQKSWGTEADRGQGKTIKLGVALGELGQAEEDAKAKAALLKQELKETNDFISYLKDNMAGAVGKENAEYTSSMIELGKQLETVKSKQQELLKIKRRWTPEEQAAYDSLQKAEDGLVKKIDETTIAFQKSMAQWRLEMLLTQMQIDGPLTDAEQEFADQFALNSGLIDEATISNKRLMREFIDSLAGQAPTWEAWLKYWNAAQSKTIYINTIFTSSGSPGGGSVPSNAQPSKPADTDEYYWTWDVGRQQWVKNYYAAKNSKQAGGPVMANAPYFVGEKGPEPFIPSQNGYILSHTDAERIFARQVAAVFAPASVSAGPVTNNYSTSNAYNLQVLTSQSPQLVQRSFAMMQLLAG